ncbi:DNA mismatch repair endonuclease MutL [Chloroflexota bacterium]
MAIHILPPEVASQIAAGEVIERPASVIKELIENSLDADARKISISYREAGRQMLKVVDDGYGIPADQLELALARHATSKLENVTDLFSISTLGFRGEALASIGSVSRLKIISRPKDSEIGAAIMMEAGNSSPMEMVAAPIGTLVTVEDLFYNVPARLKFLKKDVTEKRAIDALVRRYAMAYPFVRFELTDDKKTILQTTGDGDQRAVLTKIYGFEVADQMLEVMADDGSMSLTGFISPISLTRSNRSEIIFFVNGRWVQDTPLVSALVKAYHSLLMVARYPMAVLFLDLDSSEVDVNVHPAKAEVRFRDQSNVFSFVQRASRRALMAYSPIPSINSQSAWGDAFPGTLQVDPGWKFSGELNDESNAPTEAESASLQSGALPLLDNLVPLLRLVGQVGLTYLVAEGPDGLYLVDQHAAHERILFEKLHSTGENGINTSQKLLEPVTVTFPPEQARLVEEQLPILGKFGFEVDPFGPGTFQVRSVPSILAKGDPSEAIRTIVEDFEEDEEPLQGNVESILAGRICKRLAIKAGQALSNEEQRALLADLEVCNSPRTCPHGRPTMIHLSVDMLERQFGRKGKR